MRIELINFFSPDFDSVRDLGTPAGVGTCSRHLRSDVDPSDPLVRRLLLPEPLQRVSDLQIRPIRRFAGRNPIAGEVLRPRDLQREADQRQFCRSGLKRKMDRRQFCESVLVQKIDRRQSCRSYFNQGLL
jgi:hypothetical protein